MTGATSPRTVAIIPARYASERLPGKPLASIGGKPMIVHVMERAAQATLVHDVLAATDDDRIAVAVRSHGGKAVMTPADIRSGSDRIAFVARSLDDAAIIVNVQGDEPLIPPAMIDQAIRPLLQDETVEAGTLVRRITTAGELHNASLPKVVLAGNGDCLYFSRSPIPFGRDISDEELLNRFPVYRHIGLYVFRRDFLLTYATMGPTPLEQAEKLEQLRILEHGHRIHAEVTDYDSTSVDTPQDLERVRRIVEQQSSPAARER
ncbi:MAG: 3-deoxy-manno-octulosonate cytidylyltransferase [Bacteroidota bacterium]